MKNCENISLAMHLSKVVLYQRRACHLRPFARKCAIHSIDSVHSMIFLRLYRAPIHHSRTLGMLVIGPSRCTWCSRKALVLWPCRICQGVPLLMTIPKDARHSECSRCCAFAAHKALNIFWKGHGADAVQEGQGRSGKI